MDAGPTGPGGVPSFGSFLPLPDTLEAGSGNGHGSLFPCHFPNFGKTGFLPTPASYGLTGLSFLGDVLDVEGSSRRRFKPGSLYMEWLALGDGTPYPIPLFQTCTKDAQGLGGLRSL